MLSKVLNPRNAFFASCLFLALLYGFAASHFGWFPHRWLAPALDQAEMLAKNPGLEGHRMHPLRPDHVAGAIGYGPDGQPRTISDDENRGAGVTLLTSYWPDAGDAPGVRIVDARGAVLHHWDIDAEAIWPPGTHGDAFSGWMSEAGDYVHGTHLFENGDLLFNVEYTGLARMRPDGEVVWQLDRRTHHSVSRNERGDFWVCGANVIEDAETAMARFFGLVPPVVEDVVLEVSPDGEVLREISILELVFEAPELKEIFWSAGPQIRRRTLDVLHLNDVEELPTALADEYPMFEAGDLVVSLRTFNAVIVFDPRTRDIRWLSVGGMVNQHDPDFIGDGWISVFDNRRDGTLLGQFLGGSRLIAYRPHTGEKKTIYPGPDTRPDALPFYTRFGGKAQRLAGGRWLLTEACAGRVLEVDATGRKLWEWAQEPVRGGEMVSEVLEGTRYPLAPDVVQRWAPP